MPVLENILERAICLYHTNRLERLYKKPIKTISYAFLRRFCNFFDMTVNIRAKTFYGEKMICIIPEDVSSSIFRFGYYEEGLTRMILKYLQEGMIFVDIGAHIGYYTLLASKIVGKSGRVYSFEPTGSTFKILVQNTKERSNIFLNHCAVFSWGGTIALNDYGLKYTGFNSIFNPRLDHSVAEKLHPRKFTTKCVTLDSYFSDKHRQPNFIKIDAESAEMNILKGAKDIIKEHKPIISVEVGDIGIGEAGGQTSSRDLVSYMLNAGYIAFEWDRKKIVKHELKNKYEYNNILFIEKYS